MTAMAAMEKALAMAEVAALATGLSAVAESVTEVGCGNCGCRAVVSEAPGGTTGIGRDNSSGNGFVVVAIVGRSTAVSGDSVKGPGSGGGNGSDGKMGTAVSVGSGERGAAGTGSVGSGGSGNGSGSTGKAGGAKGTGNGRESAGSGSGSRPGVMVALVACVSTQ